MQTQKDKIQSAYNQAIKYLSVREYAIDELRNKLHSKKYAQDIISIVIDQLIDQKYIDETRFTEVYCRSRMNRGYGQKRIRYELSQKKIKDSIVQDVLSKYKESDWTKIITKQISKKVSDFPLAFPDKMKLFRALANRGFEHQEIQFAYENYIETLK